MAAKHPYAGKKLTYWRESSKLTVEKLAEKTGVSRRSIYAYEALETDIPWDKACIFAEAFGIRRSLLWGVEPPPDQGPDEEDDLGTS